jgi:hypothetical protein
VQLSTLGVYHIEQLENIVGFRHISTHRRVSSKQANMAAAFEEVSFPTLDGITMKGNLFAANRKGPAIIMTPGV